MPPTTSEPHNSQRRGIAAIARRASFLFLRTGRLSAFLLLALLVAPALTLGCGEPGQSRAAQGVTGAPAAEETPAPATSERAPSPEATIHALSLLQDADRAYEDKDYERCRDLLTALLKVPEGLTDKQVADARTRLGRATSILHQRELEAQERAAAAAGVSAEVAMARVVQPPPVAPDVARRKAAELLAKMETLASEKKHAEAAVGVDVLDGMREHLTGQDRSEYDLLRDSVQRETQQLRPLSAKEKQGRAEEDFAAGVTAYEAKDYAAASRSLAAAASFEVSLGFWDNRKLRSVRQEVDQTLKELRADLAQGRELFDKKDYAQAAKVLQKVKESKVSIGQAEGAEADELLAEATRLRDQRAQMESEQPKRQAEDLLAAARSLAGEGKHLEALGKLDELKALEPQLNPAQRVEAAGLRATAETGARAEEARRIQERIKELEGQAATLVAAQRSVLAKVQAADEALQRQDPGAARTLLLEVQGMLKQPEIGALPALKEVQAQVAQKLAAADEGITRKARVAEVAQQVEALLADAHGLAQTDLPAAEEKMLAAIGMAQKEGLALTPDQAQFRDAVLAAVEAKYGTERRLRPKLYGRLLNLADIYREHGEYGKAVQMLRMITDSPSAMVTDEYRNLARTRLGDANKALSQQEKAEADLAGELNGCRDEFTRHALQNGLKIVDGVLTKAREKKLAGAPLADLLKRSELLLTADFEAALRETYPPLPALVDERLARARIAIARGLSEFYLAKGTPDLEEPCLRQLEAGAAIDAESSAWAKSRLANIPALRAEAEKARLSEGEADARKVLDLAARLNEAARTGKLAEVNAAERALADARVQLQVEKAQSAAARGAYGEAARALEQASPEKASGSLVEKKYKPLASKVQSLVTADARLRAAEDALAAHDLATAGACLAEPEVRGAEEPPLVLKREALGAVLKSALDRQETETALRAQQERILDQARAALAQVQAREQAWQLYYEAVRAFLEGREDAQVALERVAAGPQGLLPIEVVGIGDVTLAPVVPEKQASSADAERKLAETLNAYKAGDYLAAAALLDELRDMPAITSDPTWRDAARTLAELVKAQEAQAQALYDQAVQAYKAGNADRVRALTDELKARYSRTRVYRDRM